MRSAEKIAGALCNGFFSGHSHLYLEEITDAIRSAQREAAEWMRDEAARRCDQASEQHKSRANAYFEGRDQGSAIIEKEHADAYRNAASFVRSIKLPGED